MLWEKVRGRHFMTSGIYHQYFDSKLKYMIKLQLDLQPDLQLVKVALLQIGYFILFKGEAICLLYMWNVCQMLGYLKD